MQYLPVQFDRVFDVVNRSGIETIFSFENAQGKFYGIRIAGSARIESGMKVIALLTKANNLRSIQGWYDIQSQEIVGLKEGRLYGRLSRFHDLILYVSMPFVLFFLWQAERIFEFYGLLFLSFFLIFVIFQRYRVVRAFKHLETYKTYQYPEKNHS